MAEPKFPGDDDLPRTFRREREAREREARDREAMVKSHDYGSPPQDYGSGAPDNLYSGGFSGTVTRFEVPFVHLMMFFIKAVLAAIPALILLTGLLFAGGKLLQMFVPSMRLFEIKIQSLEPPSATGPTAPAPKATAPAKK